MSTERTIVVAVEDTATAPAVAAVAAQAAMEEEASAIVVLHVVERHTVAQGLMTVALPPVPLLETADEARSVLAAAEAAVRAAYVEAGRPEPRIERRVKEGASAGSIIVEVAEKVGALRIVVGGRRAHVLGRLVHADVCTSITHHTTIPVQVAEVQAHKHRARDGEVS